MSPSEPLLWDAISPVNPSPPGSLPASQRAFCCSPSTLFVEINMEIRQSKTARLK